MLTTSTWPGLCEYWYIRLPPILSPLSHNSNPFPGPADQHTAALTTASRQAPTEGVYGNHPAPVPNSDTPPSLPTPPLATPRPALQGDSVALTGAPLTQHQHPLQPPGPLLSARATPQASEAACSNAEPRADVRAAAIAPTSVDVSEVGARVSAPAVQHVCESSGMAEGEAAAHVAPRPPHSHQRMARHVEGDSRNSHQ